MRGDYVNKIMFKSKKEGVDYTTQEKYIALAGNPNVGKSTIFNGLTGLKQHTGNWSGKTVDIAFGRYTHDNKNYLIADLPGCYSIKSQSLEEYCAAEAIRDERTDGVIVVCDACSLERNLNLVIQICEITDNVVMAVNFIDEASKKGIQINLKKLEEKLNINIVMVNARKKTGLSELMEIITQKNIKKSFKVNYGRNMETALKIVKKSLSSPVFKGNSRYISLRILENDENIWNYIKNKQKDHNIPIATIYEARHKALNYLYENNMYEDDIKDFIAITIVRASHSIYRNAVDIKCDKKQTGILKADKILTGKLSGFLIMIAMLGLIFYITIKGANYPSKFLSSVLFSFEKKLMGILLFLKIPQKIAHMLVYGGYRVLAWVVSVMLPPMAIFFPLFTILEDVGYLPRIAFNLDKCFKKCNACGKQALTTCMGFGCNSAGVTGARIIDSPREKLVAILTNSFIPCNGKFPAIISLISVFLTPFLFNSGILSSIILLIFIIFAVYMSLLASKILTKTVLKGIPASFAIELPPYRKPQYFQIFVRSVLDRTIFVLARAAVVAFPAGIILYIICNTYVSGIPIIKYICDFFDPLGKLMGLDGVIVASFILGIPANEIILPVALMIYTSGKTLVDFSNINFISKILMSNGWTVTTAICAILFFIMHWPCSTTLLTIKKETSSIKWTVLSFILPTAFGVVWCIITKLILGIIC